MSEKEKNTMDRTLTSIDQALTKEDEHTLMAITVAYAAGKEAGKRQAQQDDTQPGE